MIDTLTYYGTRREALITRQRSKAYLILLTRYGRRIVSTQHKRAFNLADARKIAQEWVHPK
jgi:hypothetical protein